MQEYGPVSQGLRTALSQGPEYGPVSSGLNLVLFHVPLRSGTQVLILSPTEPLGYENSAVPRAPVGNDTLTGPLWHYELQR